ncbi:recombinase [Roseospira marina]|nr:recombinase [Roseospira marina]MBB4315460.1 recombination protein RecA [Roseospira marina]MBB5088394.1 recombination protein RecA [Roseospira marina]
MSMTDLAKEMETFIGGNDAPAEVRSFIDTGFPPLNRVLSGRYDGGFPRGRIIEMFGPPSSGKTAIATMASISAQRFGGIAGFSDHERSFADRLARALGLNTTPGSWIYKKPRTFEDSISLCIAVAERVREKRLIDPDAPIFWTFDSLATMVPKSKMEKSVSGYGMHDNTALARATSAVFPAFDQFCDELGITALFLNQMRTKPGVVYGDPTTTPGGDAPKFHASIRIQLGARKIKSKGGDDVLGQEIGAKAVKNKITRPFQTAAWRFMFQSDGSGKFDTVGSLLDFMASNKLIEASGSRIQWDGKNLYRSQVVELIEREGRYDELVAMLPEVDDPVVEVPEGKEGGWEEPAA